MANTKKMTKKDYFAILRASYPETASNYDEVIAFIDHEVELLNRKNSAEKKPTAQQVANDGIKAEILTFMQDNVLYSITDIIKGCEACNDLTNQRVSALVRQMMPEQVERVEDKRKAFFRKVSA